MTSAISTSSSTSVCTRTISEVWSTTTIRLFTLLSMHLKCVLFGQGIFIDHTLLITGSYFLLTMFLHKISSNITCHFSCCGGCEWLHSLQYENIFSICLYKANNGDYETKTMVEERITTNITRPVRDSAMARPAWSHAHTDWTWPGHPTAWPGMPAWPPAHGVMVMFRLSNICNTSLG